MDHLSSELKGIPGLEARVHQLNSDERAAQAKLAELKRQMFETDQSIKVSLKRQMKKNYQPSTSCLNSIPFHCRHPAAALQLNNNCICQKPMSYMQPMPSEGKCGLPRQIFNGICKHLI